MIDRETTLCHRLDIKKHGAQSPNLACHLHIGHVEIVHGALCLSRSFVIADKAAFRKIDGFGEFLVRATTSRFKCGEAGRMLNRKTDPMSGPQVAKHFKVSAPTIYRHYALSRSSKGPRFIRKTKPK